jgi:hypothetical protein
VSVGRLKGPHANEVEKRLRPQARGGAKSPKATAGAKLKKVTLNFASWNRIGAWLKVADALTTGRLSVPALLSLWCYLF